MTSGSAGQSQIAMNAPSANTISNSVCGTLEVFNPTGSGIKLFNFKNGSIDSSANIYSFLGTGAYTADSNALTGIQLFFLSGMVAVGTVYVYGYRKS